MQNEGKYDEGLYQLQKWVGCPKCEHADQQALGIMGADFCPKGLKNIGPCSLECRAFRNLNLGTVIRRKTSAILRPAAAMILAVIFLSGCSHNPAGPSEQPTAKPSIAATAIKTPTAVPTAATTPATPATTPTPTSTATTIPTPQPTPTATAIPTTKHLKYYLATCSHADVYLYLPGMSSPVPVWPGNPQTYEQDVPVGQSIPTYSWSFYSPVTSGDYTTTIWIDGVLYSNVTGHI